MTELLNKLEQKINIKFKNPDLLKKSLIHKSHNHINNNEKLEFLGDRVLGLVFAKTLLKIYPDDSIIISELLSKFQHQRDTVT